MLNWSCIISKTSYWGRKSFQMLLRRSTYMISVHGIFQGPETSIGIRAEGALDIGYEVAAGRRCMKAAAARRIDRRRKKAAGVCVHDQQTTNRRSRSQLYVIRPRKKGTITKQQESD